MKMDRVIKDIFETSQNAEQQVRNRILDKFKIGVSEIASWKYEYLAEIEGDSAIRI